MIIAFTDTDDDCIMATTGLQKGESIGALSGKTKLFPANHPAHLAEGYAWVELWTQIRCREAS